MTKVEAELKKGRDRSIINVAQYLVEYAHEIKASDIHIDPAENNVLVRLRVDGVLISAFVFPKDIHSEIISRVKVLAGLRTDVHHTPQDGRFRIGLPSGFLDVRISIVPTHHGENAVFRILAQKIEEFSLADLGMSEADVEIVNDAVARPHGMVLVTGPTGSGKTTTLYSLLRILNTKDRCLVTIEDPIEYSIEGVKQIQINSATGLTFAQGLRAILRQDPDVIMVGEIRDQETARIAVNTSLTGHLLLSTLHTNDAAATLPRLLDLNIDAYLIASTVNVIIAQRLVRTICKHCTRTRQVNKAEIETFKEIFFNQGKWNPLDLREGVGCSACNGTGFKGRIGVYEVMTVDHEIKEAILRMASARDLKLLAVKNGMKTMLDDGLSKVLAGLTTLEEVMRVIHE